MNKIIITAISFLFVSTVATAFCIKGHLSVTEEYDETQNIIIGKVTDEKKISESGNFYDGINYTVKIQEVIKGNLNNTVTIFSENSSGRFPMSVGKTYILFVYHDLGHYQVDNCGNSGLLAEKQSVVEALRQLTKIKKWEKLKA